MDEFALIRHYFQRDFNRSLDLTGGNDDCASLTVPAGFCQHLSIDTMVQGVHFTNDMPAYDVGFRALATAASDLAAMGAKPFWFSLALTLPDLDEPWLAAFAAGMADLAKTLGIQLIGGDTTRGPLTISVQVAGLTPEKQFMCRANANAGELVCVTGFLGEAAGGLRQWQQPGYDQYLRDRYTKPVPRCEFGQLLRHYASACIDISDGLLADAQHIASASGFAMAIDCDKVPVSELMLNQFGAESALTMALVGGDDYELCFTIDSAKLTLLKSRQAKAKDVPIAVIGKVETGAGLKLLRDGQYIDFKDKGFNHFYA